MVRVSRFTYHIRRLRLLLLILCSVGAASLALPVGAQSPHHAALVVDFGDGRVVVRVVAFSGDTISGAELLQQSGLDVAVMVNVGGAAALCAVEGVGCAPTPQECFCQCRGSPCRYWGYFHLQDGAWVYAGMGAASHDLRDGDVDGWVWGDGAVPPPLLTWDEIWARSGAAQPTVPPPAATTAPPPPATAVPPPTAAPTAYPATRAPGTAVPPATGAPTAYPVTRAPGTAVPPATAAPTAPAATPTPETALPTRTLAPARPSMVPTTGMPIAATAPAAVSPVGGQETPLPAAAGAGGRIPWGSLAAFGGIAALLVGLGLWVRRRR